METQIHPVSTPAVEHTGSPNPLELQHELDEVLASAFFRNTQQCQNLLRYIVKHSLTGEDHLLRERVIGAEVFGRRPDYEPGEDPVVRLRASEVRKRLAQFYHSAGEATAIQIEIPAGSYKANFRRGGEPALPARTVPSASIAESPHLLATIPEPDLAPRTVPPAAIMPIRWRRAVIWGGAIGIAALLCAVLVQTLGGIDQTRFRAFWSPWITSKKPVIISVGSNAVYRLTDRMADLYSSTHGLESHGQEIFVPFAPTDTIHGSDIFPAQNSFVALGDVAAISQLVANITRQKQSYQERFPNDISFAELRNSPSVLVGGFNNPMTLELTRKLRFVFRAHNEIDDTQQPQKRWVLNAPWDSHDTEDYAVITRIVSSNDAPMLSVAGMGQYGTVAAADFVCSPTSISALAHSLPSGWEDRNLQLVLHVKIVDFKVVATDVVAVHLW
jgi:hypothetical protein